MLLQDSGTAASRASHGSIQLGRSLAHPTVMRTGILGRAAKLLLSRIGLRRLGRSLALPIGVYPRGTYDDFLREAISPELSQYTNINPRRGTSPC
jgi:hypothetical protein